MKIIFFGTYSRGLGYSRTSILLNGLRQAGAQVTECHYDLWTSTQEKVNSLVSLVSLTRIFLRLILIWLRLIWSFLRMGSCDLILVPYPGYLDIFLARLLAKVRKCPVVLDSFLCLHEAIVQDRKIFGANSLRARLVFWFEGKALKQADFVLLDTNSHIQSVCHQYQLDTGKFYRVPVGSEISLNLPLDTKAFQTRGHTDSSVPFRVLYCGSFLPFHGVDMLIKALAIYEKEWTGPLRVTLIGSGPDLKKVERLISDLEVTSVHMIPYWINLTDYSKQLLETDLCLGVFGANIKTSRVIPCKIYDALALGKAVLTADSPAIREYLVPGEQILTCTPGNPESIVQNLIYAVENRSILEQIGTSGKAIFDNQFTTKSIGENLCSAFKTL